jgi:hypothetical protein
LLIDVGSDPISGSVSNGTHTARPFSGWIDLVAAIEAVRSPAGGEPGLGSQTLGSHPGAKATEL